MLDDPARMIDRAARQAALLQELPIAVSDAADAQAAAQAIVMLGRDLLDAASSVLWLADSEGTLRLVASAGIPPEFLDRWKVITPEDDLAAMHAVRAGRPLWVGTIDAYRQMVPSLAEEAAAAQRPLAFAAVPFTFERRTLGVLIFGFHAPHPFSDDEKKLILAVAGHAGQALERARLQHAQARALTGLRIIARAGEMLAASLDLDATLTALAKAVVPEIADWCAVDMLVDGEIRRLTAQHVDPAKIALAEELVRRYPSRAGGEGSVARVLATGETIWARRITPDMIRASVSDPGQASILLSLGLRSSVQVPLSSEGRVRGVVSFIMADSGREYDEADRDVLVEIGRRASLAITSASLYAREQRARERVTRIQVLTAALARASTTAEVGDVACREGANALGASLAWLYVRDGDCVRMVADHRFPDDQRAAWSEIPLSIDTPVTRVVVRNQPVTIESVDELRRGFSALARPEPQRYAADSLLCKPLVDRNGTVVGALGFGFAGERSFSEDERAFARTLADHCEQAFDRARILDLERKARERVALLAAAGESFSATIEYDETLERMVRIALPSLADFAFFDVVEEPGVRRVSRAHDDPEVAAILAQSSWVRSERTDIDLCALSTGRSAIHPDIDEAFLRDMAVNDGHLAVLRQLRLCSMITVPVTSRGNVIGALTLCYGRSGRHHTTDDLALAEELARRGAIAVEQARLYRSSVDAARRAEEANRVKDEFLATVSHELRTPLNAIVGWAHLLDGDKLADPAFVARGMEVIRRQAMAQREIIDDILDVSRIITGKLRIQAAPVDLARIARDALDVVRPAADAKTVTLEAARCESARVMGDAARLQQVVWNLLANAVKFTPAGGTVTLDVFEHAGMAVVRVKDNGQGIAPDFLPHVFDRFKQADSSSTRAHGGLGLGLSIVRHLVELHGGTVSAASEGRGLGATFEVAVPLASGATPRPSQRAELDAQVAALAGKRVVVVDDDADSRDLVGEILTEAGASVALASSAKAAASLFAGGGIDVVVTDIAMPDMDGYTLLERLKQISSTQLLPLRAVALTAYGRAEDREASARAGFHAHVPKPVEPAHLVSTLARLVRG